MGQSGWGQSGWRQSGWGAIRVGAVRVGCSQGGGSLGGGSQAIYTNTYPSTRADSISIVIRSTAILFTAWLSFPVVPANTYRPMITINIF